MIMMREWSNQRLATMRARNNNKVFKAQIETDEDDSRIKRRRRKKYTNQNVWFEEPRNQNELKEKKKP